MRMATHSALALLVSIGSVVSPAGSSPSAKPDDGGLIRKAGRFELTLINPEADFSRYGKLCPGKVYLKLRDRSGQADSSGTGSLIPKRTKERAVVDSEDLAELEQVISDALVGELRRSNAFELVDETGPNTLLLRSAVVDIVSKEPSRAARKAGATAPLLVEGTVVFELVDAETGVTQARMGERRVIEQTEGKTANAATPWEYVHEWAQQAGADLRMELERIGSGSR